MTPARISSIQSRLGLETSQLARLCGVTPRMVRYWITGERKPGGAARIILESLERSSGGMTISASQDDTLHPATRAYRHPYAGRE